MAPLSDDHFLGDGNYGLHGGEGGLGDDDDGLGDDDDGLGDGDDGVPCDPWVRVADRDNLASRTTWPSTQHLISSFSS